jgi:hypothetical protein
MIFDFGKLIEYAQGYKDIKPIMRVCAKITSFKVAIILVQVRIR